MLDVFWSDFIVSSSPKRDCIPFKMEIQTIVVGDSAFSNELGDGRVALGNLIVATLNDAVHVEKTTEFGIRFSAMSWEMA